MRIMRRVAILAALIIASTASYAAGPTLCSGKDAQYRLEYPEVGKLRMLSPRGAELYDDIGSLGTGLNGHAYKSLKTGDVLVVRGTTIVMDANPGHEQTLTIQIANDRVFWPCQ